MRPLRASHEGFYFRRTQLAALAIRHALPAIYWDREFVVAGGLMSYRSSETDLFRQVGIHADRKNDRTEFPPELLALTDDDDDVIE